MDDKKIGIWKEDTLVREDKRLYEEKYYGVSCYKNTLKKTPVKVFFGNQL